MSTGSVRQLWLLPVLLLTVIATALGALVARDLYDEPAAPPPAVVAPPPSSAAPSDLPGPAKVRGTADAVSHPLYATLQPVLQTYFDSINAHDYARWVTTVTKEKRAQEPESRWTEAYDTVKDGGIVVNRIEAGGDGAARVLMQFTSTQDLSDSPKELPAECIHWNVVWAFEREGGDWKLTIGASGTTPQHEPCA